MSRAPIAATDPARPAGGAPTLHLVDSPTVTLPNVDSPTVTLQSVDSPTVALPAVALPAVAIPSPADERFDELYDTVRQVAEQAVDRYEIAAFLESDGITDSVARVSYDCADVFVLAGRIQQRAASTPAEPPGVTAPEPPSGALRDIAHGLLYLLPAAALPVAAATGAATMVLTDGPVALIGLGLAQMAFQMSSALLMFYRREELLFAAMVPGVVVGVLYLVNGPSMLAIALVAVGVSLLAALGLALLQTRKRATKREPALMSGMRGALKPLPAAIVYTALSAVYLLQVQSLFMRNHFDILVAFLPLFVGMGVVEWRARRFYGDTRNLLQNVRKPGDFARHVTFMLARDILICMLVVAVLAGVLFVVLELAWVINLAAVAVAAGCVVLAAAYFIGFLLANMSRYGWLCSAFAASTAVNVAFSGIGPWNTTPWTQSLAFLGSAVLLFVLFLAAVSGRVREARSFR